MSKGLFMHKQCFIALKILKLSTLIITYQESVAARNLSPSRKNLESHPSSKGVSGMQPTAMPEVQWTLYCPLFKEVDNWLISIYAYPVQMVVSSKVALNSTIFKWARCPNKSWAVVLSVSSESTMSQMQPSQPDTPTMTSPGGQHLRVPGKKKNQAGRKENMLHLVRDVLS